MPIYGLRTKIAQSPTTAVMLASVFHNPSSFRVTGEVLRWDAAAVLNFPGTSHFSNLFCELPRDRNPTKDIRKIYAIL